MKKEELYREIMRAIEFIEEGYPMMAKRVLEALANKVTFINQK